MSRSEACEGKAMEQLSLRSCEQASSRASSARAPCRVRRGAALPRGRADRRELAAGFCTTLARSATRIGDGFGLIALASLFPMITVMGYAQISSWRNRHSTDLE